MFLACSPGIFTGVVILLEPSLTFKFLSRDYKTPHAPAVFRSKISQYIDKCEFIYYPILFYLNLVLTDPATVTLLFCMDLDTAQHKRVRTLSHRAREAKMQHDELRHHLPPVASSLSQDDQHMLIRTHREPSCAIAPLPSPVHSVHHSYVLVSLFFLPLSSLPYISCRAAQQHSFRPRHFHPHLMPIVLFIHRQMSDLCVP